MGKNIIIVSEPDHIDIIKDLDKNALVIATSANLSNALMKNRIESELPGIQVYSDDFFIAWMKNLPTFSFYCWPLKIPQVLISRCLPGYPGC